jgi:hypothetical protein
VNFCTARHHLPSFRVLARFSFLVCGLAAVLVAKTEAQSTPASTRLTAPQSSQVSQASVNRRYGVIVKRSAASTSPSTITPSCSSPKLSYFGGPVVSNVQVVPVLWGNYVNSQITANISQFYSDVTASNWYDMLSEYATPGGTSGTNQSIGRGTAVSAITINPSKCASSSKCTLSDTDLQNELNAQIQNGYLPPLQQDSTGNTNTVYMVHFPANVTVTGPSGMGTSCVQFCAYHNTAKFGSAQIALPYGVIMDTFTSACSTGCGSTGATALESETSTAAHELAEAVTDANIGLDTAADYAAPAAWADNNNMCGEVADICDTNVSEPTITGINGTWAVQYLWSNKLNACVGTGLHPNYTVSAPSTTALGNQLTFGVTATNPSGSLGTDIAYVGTVHFSSSDPSAVLPADFTYTPTTQGTASFSATLNSLGSQTITATDTLNGSIVGISGAISVSLATVPGAPTIGVATAGDTQATVGFSAPTSDGGAAITGYTATANPGGATGSCAASPCTVTGLTNGTAYTFTVTATNSAGTGPASAPSNAVTPEHVTANFLTVPVGTTTATQTLTFTLATAGTIGVPAVLTQGAANLDFADAGTGSCTTNSTSHIYSVGDTCTVDVTFTPKYAGPRYGAVVLYNAAGAPIATEYLSGTGVGPQVTFLPGTQSTIDHAFVSLSVAIDGSGNVYVGDLSNQAVHKYSPNGSGYTKQTDVVTGLGVPHGVAVDGSGNVYVADVTHAAVHKYVPNGSGYTQQADVATGLGVPMGVAVDGNGNIYVADTVANAVRKYVPNGSGYTQSDVATGVGSPEGAAVDGSGNVYVGVNNAVHKYAPNGSGGYTQQSDVANGGLSTVAGVAVDAGGNVYVADYNLAAVHKYAPNGSGGYTKQADVANGLGLAGGVAVDSSGNVYFTDPSIPRVLKEDYADAPSLSFAATSVHTTSSDSPRTVTLVNLGNADLSFPVPGTGNNPSIPTNFTLDSTSSGTCPLIGSSSSTAGTLAAGASCTLPVSFAPTAVGSINGSLILTDTNLNAVAPAYATQSIQLNGTANPGPVTHFLVSAPGSATAGTSFSITVTALDAYNNTATGYTGTVHFNSTDPLAILPSDFNFTNGVHTFSVTVATSGLQTIIVTDTTNTTITGAATVTVGAISTTLIPTVTPSSSYVYGSTPPAINIVLTPSSATGISVASFTAVLDGTTPLTVVNTATNTFTLAGIPANLGAGSHTIVVSFAGTPIYAASTISIPLTVTPAALQVTANDATKLYGAANPTFAGTVTGAQNGDSFTESFSTTATASSPVGTYAIVPAVTGVKQANYTVTVVNGTLTVTPAALQVTTNNATRVYGTANPSFTGTITGAQNGDSFTESFSTTAITSSPVGTYAIVPAVTGANIAAYTQTVTNGTLTVTKAGTTTALSTSSGSIGAGTSVTLTAQLASATTGTPTGTVSFYDGSTVLGTATLSNGVASFSTTALTTTATHTLSATYGGDANFTGSTTASGVSVVVAPMDFNFQASGALSATVARGGSATFSYSIAPTSGSYPGPVNFTVTGPSWGVSYSLSQTTIAANAGPQTITLRVTTDASMAAVRERELWGLGGTAVMLGVLLPIGVLRRGRQLTRSAGRRLLLALLVAAASVMAVGLSGCGSGGNSHLPQSYSVTVTAASGSVSHTSTVSVLVR